MEMLQTICVFCGAGVGNHPDYVRLAEELGSELAQRQLRLVYGGGTVGMMGAIAQRVHSQGGDVTGVIPRSLLLQEKADSKLETLIVVDTMAERKQIMFERSDAFITLPGGFGTLDEFFEAVTFGQLGIHRKPVGLLNVNGYFDSIRQWIDVAIAQGFVHSQHRDLVMIDTNPAHLLDRLANFVSPTALVQWRQPQRLFLHWDDF